jgi:hypothetical protein
MTPRRVVVAHALKCSAGHRPGTTFAVHPGLAGSNARPSALVAIFLPPTAGRSSVPISFGNTTVSANPTIRNASDRITGHLQKGVSNLLFRPKIPQYQFAMISRIGHDRAASFVGWCRIRCRARLHFCDSLRNWDRASGRRRDNGPGCGAKSGHEDDQQHASYENRADGRHAAKQNNRRVARTNLGNIDRSRLVRP